MHTYALWCLYTMFSAGFPLERLTAAPSCVQPHEYFLLTPAGKRHRAGCVLRGSAAMLSEPGETMRPLLFPHGSASCLGGTLGRNIHGAKTSNDWKKEAECRP
jgi:hypothetical protein